MAYKLVEINGSPRVKLSNEIEKVTIPGKNALTGSTAQWHSYFRLVVPADSLPPVVRSNCLCGAPTMNQAALDNLSHCSVAFAGVGRCSCGEMRYLKKVELAAPPAENMRN